MTTHTGAVFNNGAISRLLELAVACRRDPSRTLEDELTRFCRTIRDTPQAEWAMPLATVAALLDLVSDQVVEVDPATLSAGFAEQLAEAAGDLPAPEFLRLLSGMLRLQDREPIPDFDRLPMAAWEAELKFGRIRQFWWWVDSGEYEDFDEGVRAGVASEHPHGCRAAMSALAAELQEALLLFPAPAAPSAPVAGLAETAPWASRPVLQAILQAVHAHFDEEH
ncbi:hypothetical protein ACFV9D_19305 [Streptomyces sp. NPDC059875]|uniref:hypothetical protein n=1 Tax=unclassified Streptomyces TaxID=2593676 RepID=UPI00365C1914